MATIPNDALVNNAKLLGGIAGGAPYTDFAVGSGSTAEATTQTTLAAELTDGGFERATVTATYVPTGICQWLHEFTATATRTVREMAVFNADDVMGIRHLLTSDKVCDPGETFEGTLKITNARP